MYTTTKSILELPEITGTGDYWVLGSKQGTEPGQTFSGRYSLSDFLGENRTGAIPWFGTGAQLKAAFPNPKDGEQAWAGTPHPGTVWSASGGVWSDTGIVPDVNSVDLVEYAKNGGTNSTLKQVENNIDYKESESIISVSPTFANPPGDAIRIRSSHIDILSPVFNVDITDSTIYAGVTQYSTDGSIIKATDVWFGGLIKIYLNPRCSTLDVIVRKSDNSNISPSDIVGKLSCYFNSVERILIGESLSNLNSSFKDITTVNPSYKMSGKAITVVTGKIVDNPDTFVCRINVRGRDTIDCQTYGSGTNGVAFFDINDNFISGFRTGVSGGFIPGDRRMIPVPTIAEYALYSYPTDSNADSIGIDRFNYIRLIGKQSDYNKIAPFTFERLGLIIRSGVNEPNDTVYFPCIIRTDAIPAALGKYYMFYSTDHKTTSSSIVMAYSNDLISWTRYGVVMTGIQQLGVASECETPSVVYIPSAGKYYMYWHSTNNISPNPGYQQTSYISESTDLISWTFVKRMLDIPMELIDGDGHNGYATVYQLPKASMLTAVHLMGGTDFSFFTQSYSYDGLKWFTDRNISSGQHQYSELFAYENMCGLITINGRNYLITGYGTPASGTNPFNFQIAMIEVGDDFRTQIGRPYILATMDINKGESTNIRSINTFVDLDGTVYILYNTASVGSIGASIYIAKLNIKH